MKMIKLITGAMLALGLVSSARAAATFGSTNIVYITGSTAFRAGLFETLTNNASTPCLFDVGTPVSNPSGAASGTSAYYVVGKISGNYVMVSVSLTGSEAGLASLNGTTVTYPSRERPRRLASKIRLPRLTPPPAQPFRTWLLPIRPLRFHCIRMRAWLTMVLSPLFRSSGPRDIIRFRMMAGAIY